MTDVSHAATLSTSSQPSRLATTSCTAGQSSRYAARASAIAVGMSARHSSLSKRDPLGASKSDVVDTGDGEPPVRRVRVATGGVRGVRGGLVLQRIPDTVAHHSEVGPVEALDVDRGTLGLRC